MLNITQKQWVKDILHNERSITRNRCLRNYISRLGAIICDLTKEGYEFDAKYVEVQTPFGKGKDYKYILTEESYKKLLKEYEDKDKENIKD